MYALDQCIKVEILKQLVRTRQDFLLYYSFGYKMYSQMIPFPQLLENHTIVGDITYQSVNSCIGELLDNLYDMNKRILRFE